jgi:hypothetical protein
MRMEVDCERVGVATCGWNPGSAHVPRGANRQAGRQEVHFARDTNSTRASGCVRRLESSPRVRELLALRAFASHLPGDDRADRARALKRVRATIGAALLHSSLVFHSSFVLPWLFEPHAFFVAIIARSVSACERSRAILSARCNACVMVRCLAAKTDGRLIMLKRVRLEMVGVTRMTRDLGIVLADGPLERNGSVETDCTAATSSPIAARPGPTCQHVACSC